MFELMLQLAATDPLLLAFAALIFDIPRYTLSLVSLAMFGGGRILRTGRAHAGNLTGDVACEIVGTSARCRHCGKEMVVSPAGVGDAIEARRLVPGGGIEPPTS